MIEMLFSVAASILGFIAILILKHISTKIDRSNNRQRLNAYKIDSLVDTLSSEFGNGDFKTRFNYNVRMRMKEDDFVYKEI